MTEVHEHPPRPRLTAGRRNARAHARGRSIWTPHGPLLDVLVREGERLVDFSWTFGRKSHN